MPNMNIVESSKCVSGTQLLEVRIKRDAESGLQISLQSDEKYWQTLKRADESTCTIGGVLCWKPKTDRLQGVAGYFISENVYEFESLPNMTMLLAVNLCKGVTFSFGQMPISEKRLNDWCMELEKQCKVLFLTYIKPVDKRVIFSTRTISDTYHD